MRKLTKDEVRSWMPCWDVQGPGRLDEFFAPYPHGLTALELREMLCDADWLWVVLRPEVIPGRELHLLACQFDYDALAYERALGRENSKRLWGDIDARRAWCLRETDDARLEAAAQRAAWVPALDAAVMAWRRVWNAAWDAAAAARGSPWNIWANEHAAVRDAVLSAAASARKTVLAQQCEQTMNALCGGGGGEKTHKG